MKCFIFSGEYDKRNTQLYHAYLFLPRFLSPLESRRRQSPHPRLELGSKWWKATTSTARGIIIALIIAMVGIMSSSMSEWESQDHSSVRIPLRIRHHPSSSLLFISFSRSRLRISAMTALAVGLSSSQ